MTRPASKAIPNIPVLWAIGILLSGLGGAVMTGSDESGTQAAGAVLLAIGGMFLSVAVIATGVSVGMRHRDEWNALHRPD